MDSVYLAMIYLGYMRVMNKQRGKKTHQCPRSLHYYSCSMYILNSILPDTDHNSTSNIDSTEPSLFSFWLAVSEIMETVYKDCRPNSIS